MISISTRVAVFLQNLQPLTSDSPGVIAVSGGADSVALLLACREACQLSPIVAHFNHRLRGQESDDDALVVVELALQQKLSVRVGHPAIPLDGSEESARDARYQFLVEVARETGSTWIATGHTADDLAETVLHRIIRGTGLRGLRGIPADRELAPGIRIIRPLLETNRTEIVAWLSEQGQSFREDSSNRETHFVRNRIRLEVMPLLHEFNPNLVGVLGQLARQADEVIHEEELLAAEILASCECPRAGRSCVLDCEKMTQLPTHRLRIALRCLWEREGWSRGEMSFDHWTRLAEVAAGSRTACDFPGGIVARRKRSIVTIGPRINDD